MRTFRTLDELSRWAKDSGLQHLLDAPLERDFESLEAGVRDKQMLRHLVHEHACTTLREALEHPSGAPCLSERPLAARCELLMQIAGWLADRAAGMPAIPPPPGDPRALRAWAVEHGVVDRLADPAKEIAPRIARSTGQMLRGDLDQPIQRIVDGKIELPVSQSSTHFQWFHKQIMREVRTYLHDVATTLGLVKATKSALDARAVVPSRPAVRAIYDRLLLLRDERGRGATRRPPGTYLPQPIELATEPLRFTYRETSPAAIPHELVEVVVPLSTETIEVTCHRCAIGKRCDHALAAIDAAIDFLRDPKRDAAQEQIVTELLTPDWGRFLDAMTRGVAPAMAEEEQRLVFRVSDHPLQIEALVQKPLKRGGWSVGQKIRFFDLTMRTDLLRDEREARVAEMLADEDYGYSAVRARKRIFRALTELADHGRVFVGDARGLPARIEKARLTLSFDPTADGQLAPSLSLAGRTLTAAQIRAAADGTEHVVFFDKPAGNIVLATLDERARALLAAMEKYPARFPPESHDDLVRRLEQLQGSIRIELPQAIRGEPIPADARPVVRLSPEDGAVTEVAILVRPIEGGPSFAPGEGPEEVLHSQGGRRVVARRAPADEIAIARRLVERLPLPRETDDAKAAEGQRWIFRLAGVDAVLDLLAELRAMGDEVVVEWPDPKQRIALGASAERRELKLRITDKRDWFGVEGEVKIDDQAVSLAALLEAVRNGRRYVQVAPNRFAAIEDDLRKQLDTTADLVFEGRHGLEVGLPAAAALSELVDDPGQLEAVVRFRDLVRRIDSARTLDPEVPAALTASLRPYQADGFRWLARLASWGVGGCLADDMGLGKTVQALALLVSRAAEGPALVIAPTSVGPNWVAEAKRFAPTLRVVLYRDAGRASMLQDLRPGDLLVTSYGLATRDAAALAGVRFATLILDEAQAIKNALTRRARAVRDLDAAFCVALTGTPVENHLGELWSLMRILAPGLFGSWEQFRERYAGPIERARDPGRRAALARALRPFILRRTKAEVAPELPPRTEIARMIDLSPGERRLYTQARDAALAAIASGEGDARFVLLAALTRLRRLACHPRLHDEGSTVPSSKLAALMEIVRELREEGHKALVFSQFTSHLALVREALTAEQVAYAYLDGATPSEERTRRIAAFQAGEQDLFLISLKAGGTGLNLTAADYVIHLDPWWNPAVEDQATDRAHRIGQTKPVTVVRLIARGTIEETVVSIHGEKRALAAGVFDDEGGPGQLSVDDLADLIRSGADAGADAGEDAAGDALGEEIVAEEEPQSRPRARVATPVPAGDPPRKRAGGRARKKG